MKAHPVADLFPLLEGTEFNAFTADIKTNGLMFPIVTFDDLILDGRNRYRACQAAGVEPRFEPYLGSDPVGFVVSANLRRRHLNESQRAMIAEELANLLKHRKKSASSPNLDITISEAAKLLNVGKSNVSNARRIKKHASPKVVAKVKKGEMSINAALKTLPGNTSTGKPKTKKPKPNGNLQALLKLSGRPDLPPEWERPINQLRIYLDGIAMLPPPEEIAQHIPPELRGELWERAGKVHEWIIKFRNVSSPNHEAA